VTEHKRAKMAVEETTHDRPRNTRSQCDHAAPPGRRPEVPFGL